MNKPTPPAASKPSPAGRPSPVAGKPFKMSDEITIIPQGRNTQKTPTTSSVSYIYSIPTVYTLGIFFSVKITTFMRVRAAFGHKNFFKCCDLTKKV